ESLFHINKVEESRQVIQQMLDRQVHPDLYLAMANLEVNPHAKLAWLNKAYAQFDLSPVTFGGNDEPSYNDLSMETSKEKVHNDEKISIILPAYNAEDGIHVAIESILAQTWTNIELLVVDDCSTDRTVEVVEQYVQKDDRVKLFSTPANSGPY